MGQIGRGYEEAGETNRMRSFKVLSVSTNTNLFHVLTKTEELENRVCCVLRQIIV